MTTGLFVTRAQEDLPRRQVSFCRGTVFWCLICCFAEFVSKETAQSHERRHAKKQFRYRSSGPPMCACVLYAEPCVQLWEKAKQR